MDAGRFVVARPRKTHVVVAQAWRVGWTLSFNYTAGQRLTPPGWAANWTQAPGSATVTATNLDWNRTLNAGGGNTTIGFNGTFTGSNPPPASFTLNGTLCATS